MARDQAPPVHAQAAPAADRPTRPIDRRTGGAGANGRRALSSPDRTADRHPRHQRNGGKPSCSPRSGRTWASFPRRSICGRGRGCARAATRAPASDARRASATAPPGSRPLSFRSPGRPPERRTATSVRSFTASKPAADRRRPSSPSPRRSSPPFTTCFVTAPSTKTSGPAISMSSTATAPPSRSFVV
jgi:hypothetical protein